MTTIERVRASIDSQVFGVFVTPEIYAEIQPALIDDKLDGVPVHVVRDFIVTAWERNAY